MIPSSLYRGALLQQTATNGARARLNRICSPEIRDQYVGPSLFRQLTVNSSSAYALELLLGPPGVSSRSPFLLLLFFYLTGKGEKNLQPLRCDARCREARSAHAPQYTPLALSFSTETNGVINHCISQIPYYYNTHACALNTRFGTQPVCLEYLLEQDRNPLIIL